MPRAHLTYPCPAMDSKILKGRGECSMSGKGDETCSYHHFESSVQVMYGQGRIA